MNKSAIQKYAIWARTEMIAQVEQRAYQYGITKDGYGEENAVTVMGRALSNQEQEQRWELIQQIKHKGYTQVMEEVAYTWFNRFIALRFMEVNNYLPTHIRVFSDSTGAFKPEILSSAMQVELDGLDRAKVSQMIDANQTEELYRYLLLTQCNALNEALPKMFEKMGGYTELLLPNNILRADGILSRMVNDIPEENWNINALDEDGNPHGQVQIIGWLYQYYISERHEKVVDPLHGKTIKKEDIPAATQLFTTDWVVRYMVDNSLGKYWIEHHPESKLREKLKFLVYPESGDIRFVSEPISPQMVTFFDPCMGSGHILVYAFDVLMEIYKECGYGERDAAIEIVKNNLFGVDIDDRCSQLAYFAVMMKARSYDRRFFTRGIHPNVLSIQESNRIVSFDRKAFMTDAKQNQIGDYLVHVFRHAKEIGSLQTVKAYDYEAFSQYLNNCAENVPYDIEFSMWLKQEKPIMLQLAEQANVLSQKYAVVCTNPPYMNKLESHLKEFVTTQYKPYSSDLFSVFMYRNFDYCTNGGYSAFMTPNVWMFLKAYEKLRQYIIDSRGIDSLVQIAKGSFYKEATVDVCAFVLRHTHSNTPSIYIRLEDFKGNMDVQKEAFLSVKDSNKYKYCVEDKMYKNIPGLPIAYWLSDKFAAILTNSEQLRQCVPVCIGMRTGNDEEFLRLWQEIPFSSLGLDIPDAASCVRSTKKWFPYNKGGSYRKWFGNNELVVNWEDNGRTIKARTRQKYPQLGDNLSWKITNEKYYFQPGITWSTISSGKASFRRYGNGFLFSTKGSSIIPTSELEGKYLIGLLNSKVSEEVLGVLSPTISFDIAYVGSIPYVKPSTAILQRVSSLSDQCVALSKDDWDAFETSWDFNCHPLLSVVAKNRLLFERGRILLSECFSCWEAECEERFNQLKANEEELNRIFIDIYGLQDELTPEVEDKDITVRKADLGRDIRNLISFAVGCVFGRYSLDKPALAYAGGKWDASKYSTIIPDRDNIIPICDDDYFDDDITARFVQWMETVYGKDTLEENLKFIASALGGKGTPREVIRYYFLNEFYTDHLKIYQKRPIYWLFDSGKKNGFKALIYMHRYQSDVLARMRTDYVHEMQERYRTQLTHLNDSIAQAATSERVKLNKQLKKIQDQALELQKYEEKIHHLADRNISIDLDDGVKHNYSLFTDVLAKIK